MLRISIFCVACVLLGGCGALRNSPKYQLSDDTYQYKQVGGRYEKAHVFLHEDSIRILGYKDNMVRNFDMSAKQLFVKRSFDVDVMTVGFKHRPASENLPRQLTTDFNGNVFLGYRIDRFNVAYKRTPFGLKAKYGHRGFTAGFFGGIGSTAVTPWTTNNQISDEYNGFTLSRGMALMAGVNTLTVGFGVGWDYLTDRDKSIWVYQNKPWYGLTVGLNLN